MQLRGERALGKPGPVQQGFHRERGRERIDPVVGTQSDAVFGKIAAFVPQFISENMTQA